MYKKKLTPLPGGTFPLSTRDEVLRGKEWTNKINNLPSISFTNPSNKYSRHFLGAHSVVHLCPGAINKSLPGISKGPVVVSHVLILSMDDIPSSGNRRSIKWHLKIMVRLQAQLRNGQNDAMEGEGGKHYFWDHLGF